MQWHRIPHGKKAGHKHANYSALPVETAYFETENGEHFLTVLSKTMVISVKNSREKADNSMIKKTNKQTNMAE